MASTERKISPSRFEANWDGWMDFRQRSGSPLAATSKVKWEPFINRIEELRVELFDAPWDEIEPEDIAFDLWKRFEDEVRGRGGAEPSSNTLRGRFDACKRYFDFLVLTQRMTLNPLSFRARPSSKPKRVPFLTPEEDEKLALLEKEGHEKAVYALARGAALREGEITELEDTEVDLDGAVIVIGDGKTDAATRRIPIGPTTVLLLRQYRTWRDANCPHTTTRFIRTRSGAISKGYVWKLVKAMARRAEIRLLRNEDGEVIRDDRGDALTEIAPHALRRTYGSDLVSRNVPTVVFSPIIGHAGTRVTEESYSQVDDEVRARKVLLAAGEGPFSLAGGTRCLEEELVDLQQAVELDPKDVLKRLQALRVTAEAFERQLAAVPAA